MINDDALDLCNSGNIEVKNCFFRAQDDSIAIKGHGGAACEKINIHDCVFWTDRANIFRVGYECGAEAMRDITATDIDVLYYSVNYRAPSEYWANAIVWLQPNQQMLMSNCAFDSIRVRSNGDDIIMLMAKPMKCTYGEIQDPTPGRVANCVLKNFTVYGERGAFRGTLHFEGFSEECFVKNITLENFNYFGEKITKDSPCVEIGNFVEGVEIK